MHNPDYRALEADWPRYLQYYSDRTPNKLVGRIIRADRELHAAT